VEAERQYGLVGAIANLYRANGVNADTALALFLADRGTDQDGAVGMARAGYAVAPGVYAADALAWALHQAGRSDEALAYANDALRAGTPDALLHYHAGMIHLALANDTEAERLLRRALDLNPHFSLTHAPKAAAAREALLAGRSAN
jgi:tetratricopeptide (TPR) repeat protein